MANPGLIADISDGHADLGEVLLLIAFVLCVVAAVLRLMARDIAGTLAVSGLGLIALALFVL
jgi:hypothetical protein